MPMNCCNLINFFGSVSITPFRLPTYDSMNISQDNGRDDEIMILNKTSEILKLSPNIVLVDLNVHLCQNPHLPLCEIDS